MTYPGRSGGSYGRWADNEEEEAFLIYMGMLALGAVLGSAGLLWLKGATWLVEHQVLVAAAADPLVVIPGTGGAGLDVSRAAIAAAVILVALVSAVSAARRAWARDPEVG